MQDEVRERVCQKINSLFEALQTGPLCTDEICTKGRLSTIKLALGVSVNSLLSDPPCYQAYRRLKFLAEDIQLSTAQVAIVHQSHIEAIQKCRRLKNLTTRSELARCNKHLYREVCWIPESSSIFRLAGLDGGRADFLYQEDDELIAAAAKFLSWSDLKNKGGELHRHIKGRELEDKLRAAHPQYAGAFRIGLKDICYRSTPELVLGNMLVINQVDFRFEMPFSPPGRGDQRALQPDFFFPAHYAILEVAQNTRADRGSRRVAYVERNQKKADLYQTVAGLQACFVDSEPHYRGGGFDIPGWIAAVRTELATMGVDIGPNPPNWGDLSFENNEVKRVLLNAPLEKLTVYLLDGLGIEGIADYQNHFSPLKQLLSGRDDYPLIVAAITRHGREIKEDKRQRFAVRRLANYAPLSEVKKFMQQHNITTQPQWNAFAKAHKAELSLHRIPANLRAVYSQRGEWISWTPVLAERV